MDQSKITFANNESLIINDGEFFLPINLIESKGESFTSRGLPFEITTHQTEGLIPSVTELCLKSSFFFHADEPNIIYNPSTIVSIENI